MGISGRYVFVAGARSLEVVDIGPYQVKDVAALEGVLPGAPPAAAAPAAPAPMAEPAAAQPATEAPAAAAPGTPAATPAAPMPGGEVTPEDAPMAPMFNEPMPEAPPGAPTVPDEQKAPTPVTD